jgi:hypothetical protein
MSNMHATSTLPRPIAVVLQHHGELQTAYIRQRAALDTHAAFVGALSDVLNEHDRTDLSRLISGSYDESYDAQRGAELGQLLLDELEQSYQDIRRLRDQARRWRDLDAGGVVLALATDVELAEVFVQALEERNETTAQALVSSAVRTVVEKSSVTRTAPATRRALEDAIATFRRHATDGQGRPPQLALLDDRNDAPDDVALAAWCEALAVGVNASLSRAGTPAN